MKVMPGRAIRVMLFRNGDAFFPAKSVILEKRQARQSQFFFTSCPLFFPLKLLHLNHAPYVLYGVKYIGLVSLARLY